MVYQLNTGGLFIIETSGKKVTVHKDIDALCLEVFKIIDYQFLTQTIIAYR
jgi:hypothetical protein